MRPSYAAGGGIAHGVGMLLQGRASQLPWCGEAVAGADSCPGAGGEALQEVQRVYEARFRDITSMIRSYPLLYTYIWCCIHICSDIVGCCIRIFGCRVWGVK